MTTFVPEATQATEWCTPVGCIPSAQPDPVVVLWTGLTTMVVLMAVTHLPRAQDVCAKELTRTHDEQAAFERFAREVATLEPTTDVSGTSGAAHQLSADTGSTRIQSMSMQQPTDGADLEKIRRAYRESVLAVPHYEEEFDESLARNLSVEFGEGIAHGVLNGNRLTPHLQSALVKHSRKNAQERASLVAALNQEQETLSKVSERLQSIEDALDGLDEASLHHRSYEELLTRYHDLDSRHKVCRDLLDERQTLIQEGYHLGPHILNRFDGVDFHTYLYRSMDVRHPVLADLSAINTRITTTHDRVATELGRRV